jgi:hypothetical protein
VLSSDGLAEEGALRSKRRGAALNSAHSIRPARGVARLRPSCHRTAEYAAPSVAHVGCPSALIPGHSPRPATSQQFPPPQRTPPNSCRECQHLRRARSPRLRLPKGSSARIATKKSSRAPGRTCFFRVTPHWRNPAHAAHRTLEGTAPPALATRRAINRNCLRPSRPTDADTQLLQYLSRDESEEPFSSANGNALSATSSLDPAAYSARTRHAIARE